MTLDKIETPFEHRRAIRYGKDGNKAIRHWYNVRPVIGPLYMSEVTEDNWGTKIFDLFVFFPDVKDGLFFGNMRNPERYTSEGLLESAKHYGLESKGAFIVDLDERMARNGFIGNADIEFVRQWDTERAAACTEYRTVRLAKQEERARQYRMELEAEEARENAAKEARLKEEKAKYLGWADDMSPLRFWKADATLGSLVRSDGNLMTRREFVIWAVKDGWMPEKKEGVTSWHGNRWDRKESKPKTEYRLAKENLSYKVTKTEFDFATYLVAHKEEI